MLLGFLTWLSVIVGIVTGLIALYEFTRQKRPVFVFVLVTFAMIATSLILASIPPEQSSGHPSDNNSTPVLDTSSLSDVATPTPTDTPISIPVDTPTPTPKATPMPNYIITSFTVDQTNVAWSDYAKFTMSLNIPVTYPMYIEVQDISSNNPGPYGIGDYGGICWSDDPISTCNWETTGGNQAQSTTITFAARVWNWYTKETLARYPSTITVSWLPKT